MEEIILPEIIAINLAFDAYEVINRKPDNIDLDAIGGIVFWFYNTNSSSMFSFRNDGKIIICSYTVGSNLPDVQTLESVQQIKEIKF